MAGGCVICDDRSTGSIGCYRFPVQAWAGNDKQTGTDKMKQWMTTRAQRGTGWSAAALASLVLVGCGGGGGGDAGAVPAPDPVLPSATVSNHLIESSGQPVLAAATDIDDSGRVSVLFAQDVGGRVALQVVRGVPGAQAEAPVFNQPAVIDAQAPYNAGQLGLTVSPTGNAVAMWSSTAPCTALTYKTTGDCNFVYTARRLSSSNTWETPVLVGDTPSTLPRAIINDAGDVALLWPKWQRDAQGTVSLSSGVIWKASGDSSFASPAVFNDIVAPANTDVGFTMDRVGNMVYVSLSTSGAVQTVVARRGKLATGFGPTERLDTQPTTAQLEGVWGGVNGQAVVLWQQSNGAQLVRWAATLDNPDQQLWQISDRGTPLTVQRAGLVKAAVADNGDFFRYDLDNCKAMRRTGGVWQAVESDLPQGLCQRSTSFASVVSRTGDLVGGLVDPSATAGNTGQWLSYDATPGTLTHALGAQPVPYLLGTATTLGGNLLLAENGVAALVTTNFYNTLPSASSSAGTLGAATNLWVVYLKLP